MIAKVVLDTNIIIASLSTKSKYRIVIDKLLDKAFILIVTTEILLEYEERIRSFYNETTTTNFIDALILLPNVLQCEPLFTSALIKDADDNKFVDAYYSGKAKILVTNDGDFKVLKKIEYPKHNIMNIDEFVEFLKNIPPPTTGEYSYAMAA